MEALKYFEIKKRMTNKCEMDCVDCPLYHANNNKKLGCKRFETLYPNEAIKIVEDWDKENPLITNKDKYFKVMKETFGNDFTMDVCSNGIPQCRCDSFNCSKCEEFWGREYKKKEEE